jgi:fructokinase
MQAGQSAGRVIAGVELGGTKCICALADGDGHILDQATIPTGVPAQTIAAIVAQLDRWWQHGRFSALGIASFGPLELDPAAARYGSITTTAKPGWPGTAVVAPIAARFDVPVAFDTDVNGAALAEGRWGAARGAADYAYVTVGTGVGVGLIVNGTPTRGLGHCELGHMVVARLAGDDWKGSCVFHDGCVEGLASGTAIAARLGAVAVDDVGPDHPVWDGVVDALAHLAHVLVLAAGPRRIIVGGGVASGQPHLLPRIEARLRTILGGYVPIPDQDAARPYVCAPGLGTDAGPLGPIALALAAMPRARAAA